MFSVHYVRIMNQAYSGHVFCYEVIIKKKKKKKSASDSAGFGSIGIGKWRQEGGRVGVGFFSCWQCNADQLNFLSYSLFLAF